MSILTKAKTLTTVALNPNLVIGRSKYLFILSHMRSRSSVLSHILGSNAGVCGYYELHSSYLNYADIVKMRINLYNELKCDLRGKYLLDKMLHNGHEISNEMFVSITPKVIFLIRNPESTIKSIINMGHITDVNWYKNEKKATSYYCSRLERLAEYAEMLDGNYFFLEADELIKNTDHVLKELTEWLGLDTPLSNDYTIFDKTGKPDYGDPSEIIRAGKLIKTKGYTDITIPLELKQKAEISYEQCKQALIKI